MLLFLNTFMFIFHYILALIYFLLITVFLFYCIKTQAY